MTVTEHYLIHLFYLLCYILDATDIRNQPVILSDLLWLILIVQHQFCLILTWLSDIISHTAVQNIQYVPESEAIISEALMRVSPRLFD